MFYKYDRTAFNLDYTGTVCNSIRLYDVHEQIYSRRGFNCTAQKETPKYSGY